MSHFFYVDDCTLHYEESFWTEMSSLINFSIKSTHTRALARVYSYTARNTPSPEHKRGSRVKPTLIFQT